MEPGCGPLVTSVVAPILSCDAEVKISEGRDIKNHGAGVTGTYLQEADGWGNQRARYCSLIPGEFLRRGADEVYWNIRSPDDFLQRPWGRGNLGWGFG